MCRKSGWAGLISTLRSTRATTLGVNSRTERPSLTQGENVMTGGRLTYNTRTEAAEMDGGGQNGRVQGVFYPERSGD